MHLVWLRKSYRLTVLSLRRAPYELYEYHAGQIYQAEERITDQPKADGCKF